MRFIDKYRQEWYFNPRKFATIHTLWWTRVYHTTNKENGHGES